MNQYLLSFAIVGQLLNLGCASTASRSSNVSDRQVAIFSTADRRTAMDTADKDKTVKGVIEDLKKDVKERPRNLQSWLSLGHLYVAQMRLDDAESAARRALRLDIRNSDAKKILAQVAIRRGQVNLATIILNGVETEDPKDPDIMNMRALISLANNDASGAMELFQRALKLDPGNVSVRMNLGVSYLRFRQLGAASVQFERVLKLNPDHADALLHLAVIKSARGEHESAEKIYEDVLADKLNNPLALYNLAVLQQRTGEFDASLNNLKTYLKTAPARTEDTNQALMLIERIKDLRNQVRQSGADEDQDIETMVARQQERDAEDSKKSKPNDEDAANSDDARDPELMDLEDQLID